MGHGARVWGLKVWGLGLQASKLGFWDSGRMKEVDFLVPAAWWHLMELSTSILESSRQDCSAKAKTSNSLRLSVPRPASIIAAAACHCQGLWL